MICSKCNNEINDNAKFCPYCGNVVEQTEEVYQEVQQTPDVVESVENIESVETFSAEDKKRKKKSRRKKFFGVLCFVLAIFCALYFALSVCWLFPNDYIFVQKCKDFCFSFINEVPYREELELARVELLFAINDVEEAINSGDYDTIYNSTDKIEIAEFKSKEYEEIFNKVRVEIHAISDQYLGYRSCAIDPVYLSPISFSTVYYNEYRQLALECFNDPLGSAMMKYFREDKMIYELDGSERYYFESYKADNCDYEAFSDYMKDIERSLYLEYERADRYWMRDLIGFFISGILATVFFIIGRKCIGKKKVVKQKKSSI